MKGICKKGICFGSLMCIIMVMFMPCVAFAAPNDYNYIELKLASNFSISEFINGKLKKTNVEAKFSDIDIDVNGDCIEFNKESIRMKNGNKTFVLRSSEKFNSLFSLDFNENSIVDISGDVIYNYKNERYVTKFHKTIKASKANNKCQSKSASNSYGFEYEFSKNAIQKMMNTSVINISKEWKDNSKNKRPSSSNVIIYQNDEKYKTVSLSEKNGWTFSLIDLPIGDYYYRNEWKDYKYSVKELPEKGYKCESIKHSNTDNVTRIVDKADDYVATDSKEDDKEKDDKKADDKDAVKNKKYSFKDEFDESENEVLDAACSNEGCFAKEVVRNNTSKDIAKNEVMVKEDVNHPKKTSKTKDISYIIIAVLILASTGVIIYLYKKGNIFN